MADQLAIHITGLIVVLLWSLVLSYVIAKAVQALTGLRVASNTEEQGLDLRLLGEPGYKM
jgi:ammonia channel protein AmtB